MVQPETRPANLALGQDRSQVLSSRVEQTGTTCEFDHPTYGMRARVEYCVDGKLFRTAKVHDFAGDVSSLGKIKPLPRGSGIPVYYNPADPSEAILDRAALRFGICLALLGFGFIALEWHWVGKSFF